MSVSLTYFESSYFVCGTILALATDYMLAFSYYVCVCLATRKVTGIYKAKVKKTENVLPTEKAGFYKPDSNCCGDGNSG